MEMEYEEAVKKAQETLSEAWGTATVDDPAGATVAVGWAILALAAAIHEHGKGVLPASK